MLRCRLAILLEEPHPWPLQLNEQAVIPFPWLKDEQVWYRPGRAEFSGLHGKAHWQSYA
jgi:hypothetical protein